MEVAYNVFWIVTMMLAVGVLSQDCNFEDETNPLCGWVAQESNNDYDWSLRQGPTPQKRTGPDGDHTSGAGKYVFAQSSTEGSGKRLLEIPRKTRTRFTSPTIHTSWVPKVMRFYYYLYGKHVGILNVFTIVRGVRDSNHPSWRKTREAGQLWKLGELRLPANSTIKVVFEAISGKGIMGDIAIDDITFNDAPADCTFEEEIPDPVCRYTQDANDNFDWQSNRGKTPTRRTGPATDHTLDNSRGSYMYTEASGPDTNDKAYLVSPRYTKDREHCELSFWYQMYGDHIGHLKVHIMRRPGQYGTPAWQIAGEQGNIWHEGIVNLTTIEGDYQVVFEGIRGTGHEGDIAIDDIRLLGIDCITKASFQELTTNETTRDYCISNPCINGGVCMSGSGRYTCNCTEGWTGENCQLEAVIDYCFPQPCINGGNCINLPGTSTYRCDCPTGWSGKTCQVDVDECLESPCRNNGTCTNFEGGFNCTCTEGWHGDNCGTECADTNKNCRFWAGVGECKANPRYMNNYCQESCGVCQDYVCQDTHKNCVLWESLGECKTNPFFMLANCHASCGVCIDDECVSDPCLNGGNCTDGHHSYTCTCASGFEGADCEIDIDECLSSPCQNGGTCIDDANGYNCNCTDNFMGDNCEQRVTPCMRNPCLNNATCNDVDANNYMCVCPSGFIGSRCQTDIDECASNPCLHGGTCEDQPNGFLCHCVQEWTGPTCASDFDECRSNPCLNGATCFHGVGLDLFVCTCAEGWQGNICEMEVNECESSPCQNMGMCRDRFGGYDCTCADGWYGVNCELEIDECASNPCINGKCIEKVNGYRCLCFPGFNGVKCNRAIDECASNPCQNGARCEDQHNGHLCVCPTGFKGRYCEQVITTTVKTTTPAPTTKVATTKAATTKAATKKAATTKAATTKAATTRVAITKAATTKSPTTKIITKAKIATNSPTKPAAVQELTTEDWVPSELEESSIPDSEYSGGFVDDTEPDTEEPETSTSNKQTTDNEVSTSISVANNNLGTSRAKPVSKSDADTNEITILQTLPVSKPSGKTEPVSRGIGNASHNNLHAPEQVAPIGHIIAIVVGAVFVITILAFLIILVVRQKKKARIGRYEHFSMDFKQDPVAWKDLDNRSDDTDPDLAVAKM